MILDLFAGPGGWDEGLRLLARTDVVGLELHRDACRTAVAAGHARIRADVEHYPPDRFAGCEGLIASPPCQDFSLAGNQTGRTGERGRLIDLVPLWVERVDPEWVVCEQVPPCLPIWQEHAHVYRKLGYSTWAGVLNAADFGVPQTRRRAILIASRGPAVPPEPTHAKTPVDGLFDTRLPWVSMADALGWAEGDRIRPARGVGIIERHGDRPDFTADRPSPAVISKTRTWTRFVAAGVTGEGRPKDPASQPADTLTGKGTAYWQRNGGRTHEQPNRPDRSLTEPAPTIAFGNDAAQWVWERPATTVACDPRIWPPGHKINQDDKDRLGSAEAEDRYGDRAGTNSVRVTVQEAAVLQSFRPDYPWQGSRTSQYQQVGNAVPPVLAAHILRSVVCS